MPGFLQCFSDFVDVVFMRNLHRDDLDAMHTRQFEHERKTGLAMALK